ncbi:MAG: hypothetical protein K2G51_08010 [Lachnospiraceae bacterium]|nr:hypothetical protein [Lachnospiraceae bacterium]MDE7274194.1 hypothetical protein [Lachnospiraceae bacterium]
MKKKVFVILCVGMMMTGCADQKAEEQVKPEVISLDLGGNIQDEEANGGQENPVDSDADRTVQPGENTESQEPEAEISSEDYIERVQKNENTQDIYMQFINNQVSLVIGNDYPQDEYRIFNLERGKSYTFAELGQYVNQSYFDPEYAEKTSYDYVQYTYVECLDSNSKNFLIKYVGLNIYSPNDDSFVVYVLTEDNGQLYLTDGYECWARSYTEQYRDGLCINGGSAGAGDHYSGMSVILSNGRITDIYEEEILSGWWTNYINGEIYSEVFDENTEVPLNVSIYTIGEEKYYTYDLSECTDDQVTLCETYINRCRDEAEINWATDEEVDEAARKRCSSIGVNYDTIGQQKESEWTNI